MPTIRLIRPEPGFGSRGPGNGMTALRSGLIRHGLPDWLELGGDLQPGDIPWVWCWLDKQLACGYEFTGRPYILGPNIFFADSARPSCGRYELELLNAKHCAMSFTESEWYADLIRVNMGANNRTPIEIWPYPIDPIPPGPAENRENLLIYAKAGTMLSQVDDLRRLFSPSITLTYGSHTRVELSEAARHSWACAYLSDNDRGPLALAEIMLSGCPAVGVPHGAPWIEEGITGFFANHTNLGQRLALYKGILPQTVRNRALERFSLGVVVSRVLGLLERIAVGENKPTNPKKKLQFAIDRRRVG